ncbi:MAG: hypothetical protein HGA84_09190, partial [Syntrophobacteraceae bacterium]|nr:hypothetical protein [Syntrophobacteraceae bacterium]
MATTVLKRVSETFSENPEAEMFDGEVLSDDSVKLPVDKADVVRPDFGRSQRSAERVLSISEVTARFFDDTTSR